MLAHSLHRWSQHRLLVCLVLLAGFLALDVGVRPASAQRPDSSAKEITTRRDTTTAPRMERKSSRRAVLYSLGGTTIPVTAGLVFDGSESGGGLLSSGSEGQLLAIGTGLVVGPALSHFYAENHTRALSGIGLRVGGSALSALGFIGAVAASLEGSGGGGATLLFLTGGLTTLTSAGYDIFTADDAARDHNEAHGLNTQVAPTVGPSGEQVGLSLRVSF